VTAATPIVFVMHGHGRDPDRYLREWTPLADANRFILVVPEFDNARFPGSRSYNHGNFRDAQGRERPRDSWSFSAIDPLFDEVRARTGSQVPTYAIYGHSAGAQFVHRFALFMPEARFHAAVSANAGSYAFPTFDVAFPFGLGGTPVDQAALARALAKPMVILLGTADIDPDDDNLPRQPEAMRQGPYRLARGEAFYAAAKAKAAELGVRFGWQLKYAKGIGHSNGDMAAFAAPLLGAAPTNRR
jgi:poly(3-hydroxybutyrate) depolymerase